MLIVITFTLLSYMYCHPKLHHMLSSSDDLLVKRAGDPLMQYKTLINNNTNNISIDGLLFDTHKVVGNPLLKPTGLSHHDCAEDDKIFTCEKIMY